ncbi:MAG: hypothetical protein ACI84K_001769 [Pseudohongiellaceae bacterium]|jgi:hypothetical protein
MRIPRQLSVIKAEKALRSWRQARVMEFSTFTQNLAFQKRQFVKYRLA